MNDNTNNSIATPAGGSQENEEQKAIRFAMELATTWLIMKIHSGDISAEKSREELGHLLAQWKGASDDDIREAHEDVESTLAHTQPENQNNLH